MRWLEVSRIETVEQAGDPLGELPIVGHRNDSVSEPARVTSTFSRQHMQAREAFRSPHRRTLRPMLRVALSAVVIALSVSGCGEENPGPGDFILTREDAIRYAPGIFNTAVRQGYNGPCIYEGGYISTWSIAVDKRGGRPFEEVARTCQSYATGKVRHVVVMSLDGEIVEAR